MNPFGKLAGLFGERSGNTREEKSSAVSHLQRGAETVWLGLGEARWSNRTYRSLAEEGYKKNVVAHRSVKLLAESAASVPLILFRDGRKLDHHPLLDLLGRPNPMQGRMTFLESLYSFLNIAGNSYVELVRGAGGLPSELYVLRSDRIRLDQGKSGWPRAFVYSLGGREHVFPVDPVDGTSPLLHLKYFHPLDDLYGLSPLEAAAMAVDVHNAASSWNKALFDNAARPSGALVFEAREGQDSLSNEQFDRLKSEMADSFQGSRNAGRPMLLEGGLKWQKLAFSPADMDFINGKHVSAREVALAFGIPPMLLGIPGDNTYSNFQEANRALWRMTLLPMMERVISSLNNWLCPEYGQDIRLSYDQDAIPALNYDRQLLWQRIGAAEFLTTDENRAAVGLGPLEQADGEDR